MKPVVPYMGGKRKLAQEVLRHLHLRDDRTYYEPYVGMGAVYLAARASGFRGLALLGDTNRGVTAFWKCVHDASLFERLLARMREACAWEQTNAAWYARADLPVPEDLAERAATWLWFQEGSFGGVPMGCDGQRWQPAGCALDSHARLRASGKLTSKHEFARNIGLVEQLRPLIAMPCGVLEGPFQEILPSDVGFGARVYADPPYENTGTYKAAQHNLTHVNHAATFAPTCRVVLSEQNALCPDGFREVYRASRVQRVKGHGRSDCTERILVGGEP